MDGRKARKNVLLDSGHLELSLPRHSHDAAHDGLVTDGENDTRTHSLNQEGRREGEVVRLEGVLGCGMDGAYDGVTGS